MSDASETGAGFWRWFVTSVSLALRYNIDDRKTNRHVASSLFEWVTQWGWAIQRPSHGSSRGNQTVIRHTRHRYNTTLVNSMSHWLRRVTHKQQRLQLLQRQQQQLCNTHDRPNCNNKSHHTTTKTTTNFNKDKKTKLIKIYRCYAKSTVGGIRG